MELCDKTQLLSITVYTSWAIVKDSPLSTHVGLIQEIRTTNSIIHQFNNLQREDTITLGLYEGAVFSTVNYVNSKIWK